MPMYDEAYEAYECGYETIDQTTGKAIYIYVPQGTARSGGGAVFLCQPNPLSQKQIYAKELKTLRYVGAARTKVNRYK